MVVCIFGFDDSTSDVVAASVEDIFRFAVVVDVNSMSSSFVATSAFDVDFCDELFASSKHTYLAVFNIINFINFFITTITIKREVDIDKKRKYSKTNKSLLFLNI